MVCEAQAQPLPLTLVRCCGTYPGCRGISSLYFALNLDRGPNPGSPSHRPPISIPYSPTIFHRNIMLKIDMGDFERQDIANEKLQLLRMHF